MTDAITVREIILAGVMVLVAAGAVAVTVTVLMRRLHPLRQELADVRQSFEKMEATILNLSTKTELSAITEALQAMKRSIPTLATKEQLGEMSKDLPTQTMMNQLLKMNKDLQQGMLEIIPRAAEEKGTTEP